MLRPPVVRPAALPAVRTLAVVLAAAASVAAPLAVAGRSQAASAPLWALARSVPLGTTTSVTSVRSSADGRWAVASAATTGLVAACDGVEHIYLVDTASGSASCLDRVARTGAAGNGEGWAPAISADGSTVAFVSASSNLVPGDTDTTPDVLVWSRATGALDLASVTTGGARDPAGGAFDPALSGDGHLVTFTSQGALAPGASGTVSNVFLRDRAARTTVLLSGTGSAAAGTNLVPDPGVEEAPGTTYTTHGSGGFAWATDEAHAGTHALRIDSTQAAGALARWMTRTDAIAVAPGASVQASAWLRTRGVTRQAALAATFWSAGWTYLGTTLDSATALHGDTGWSLLSLAGTAPPGTAYVRLEVRLTGPGTVWADDLALSAATGAVEAGGSQASISADGSVVAFVTRSPAIAPGLPAPEDSIVALNRISGAFTRLATRTPCPQCPRNSATGQLFFDTFISGPLVSADGSRVAYSLGLATWSQWQVVVDVATGATVADTSDNGVAGALWNASGPFRYPLGPPSADGSRVAFAEVAYGSGTFVRDSRRDAWERLPVFAQLGQLAADGTTMVLARPDPATGATLLEAYRRQPAAALPAATSPPTVAGTARVGLQLTGSLGTWTDGPVRFFTAWESCAPDGSDCRVREGLNDASGGGSRGPGSTPDPYVVRTEDAGRIIRLHVAAETDDAIVQAASVPTTTVTGQALPNLAPDGDVEADPAPTWYGVGDATFSWESVQAISPTHSLRIDSSQASGALARWLTRPGAIPVVVGRSYAASAQLASSGVTGQGVLSVTFWTAAGAYAGTTVDAPATVTGSRWWAHPSLVAVAPPDSAWMRVEIRLFGPGTLYADDIVVNDVTGLGGGGGDGGSGDGGGGTPPPPANLAPDPGFEAAPDVAWSTLGSGTFTWTGAADAHAGLHAVAIATSQPADALARWMTPTAGAGAIPAAPGDVTTVSAWLRTSDATGNAQLAVTYWRADGSYAGVVDAAPQMPHGTQPWTLATVASKAPAGASTLRVELRLWGPGSVWADDVAVTRNG